MVRRCVEGGRFRPVDVETTSQALWAAIHGITSLPDFGVSEFPMGGYKRSSARSSTTLWQAPSLRHAPREHVMVENPAGSGPPAVADRRSWFFFFFYLMLLPFCNGADTIVFYGVAGTGVPAAFRAVKNTTHGSASRLSRPDGVPWRSSSARGMVPIPGIGYYIFLVLFGITLVLLYATDRLLHMRLADIEAHPGVPRHQYPQ